MTQVVFPMLRFRDLTVDEGETISEHRSILSRNGGVWWGWWKRQTEVVPTDALTKLQAQLEANLDHQIQAYLLDAGQELLYRVKVDSIRMAPSGTLIQSPDVFMSPDYYHRGRYPVWFRLTEITETNLSRESLVYHAFPTNLQVDKLNVGKPMDSISEARALDVTLYLVNRSKQDVDSESS